MAMIAAHARKAKEVLLEINERGSATNCRGEGWESGAKYRGKTAFT